MPKLSDRFWSKVQVAGPDECWEWQASWHQQGYGLIRVGHRVLKAHRVAWSLGAELGALCVLHSCDNPSCVNPGHLFLGTQEDNVYDMRAKGRGVSLTGEASGRARVTDAEVHEIRLAHSWGVRQVDLAAVYGISQTNVSSIVRGKTRSAA